jgi:RNA polymerase sigma-70 factor (ECF subfamily)
MNEQTFSSNLLQRLRSGDSSCFDDILALYAEDILRLCVLLLKNEEDAKDILQETLLRLIRAVRGGKLSQSNGHLKGYLITIARNLCIDKLRKKMDWYSLDEANGGGMTDCLMPMRRIGFMRKRKCKGFSARR